MVTSVTCKGKGNVDLYSASSRTPITRSDKYRSVTGMTQPRKPGEKRNPYESFLYSPVQSCPVLFLAPVPAQTARPTSISMTQKTRLWQGRSLELGR